MVILGSWGGSDTDWDFLPVFSVWIRIKVKTEAMLFERILGQKKKYIYPSSTGQWFKKPHFIALLFSIHSILVKMILGCCECL